MSLELCLSTSPSVYLVRVQPELGPYFSLGIWGIYFELNVCAFFSASSCLKRIFPHFRHPDNVQRLSLKCKLSGPVRSWNGGGGMMMGMGDGLV